MSSSGWFWCTVLFFVPAAAVAGIGWWARRAAGPAGRPVGSRPWWVAAQVVLALSLLLTWLIASGPVWATDFPMALLPLGLSALTGANWWLLRARPRWAAGSLAATAVALPFAVGGTASLFVVDQQEVPPGPNPATSLLVAALVAVLYSLPAVIAAALVVKADPADATDR